jgi:ribosome-associated protein
MKHSFPPIIHEALEGISEMKGEKTVVIDLRHIENSVCNYFIITEAQSNTQVSAISSAVEKRVKEQCDEKAWHTEGLEQSEWILMDYVDTVIHVFETNSRYFYDIESLWKDGKTTKIKD